MTFRFSPIVATLVLTWTGCTDSKSEQITDTSRAESNRKADSHGFVVGSCENACGGMSETDICYCDDACEDIGDCCIGPQGKSAQCAPPCCDPVTEPAGTIEGADCCADGTWALSTGSGNSCGARGGLGHICEAPCCDPVTEPTGTIEGADCCADGTWALSTGSGNSCGARGGLGHICEAPCCDPVTEPTGTIEGADCCADGTWALSTGSGNSCGARGGLGHICDGDNISP